MESIIVFLIWLLIAAASFAKAKKAKKTGTNAKKKSIPRAPSAKKTQTPRISTKEIQPKPQTIKQKELSVSEGESLYSVDQQGSLAFESFEGEDVCDPSLAHGIAMIDRTQEKNDAQAPSYSAFSFDVNAVRNGFVMSEIINEPAWKRMHR